MRRLMLAAIVAATIAIPAAARDRTGFQAISAGDLSMAEQTLRAERRIYPDRPELMLNLAAVYARTGRVMQAGSLYDAALSRPDVALEMPDGSTASSHALAATGKARLGAPAMASR